VIAGAPALNAALIGQPDGRARLETPALLLDLDAFEHNVARLAALAAEAGIGLLPHAKTHKSARIAKAQLAAGARAIGCAKAGELLALRAAGVGPLVLTAPVASRAKIAALARAAAEAPTGVVIDRPELAAAYGAATREASTTLDAYIDLDVGLGRFGVATPAEAVAIGRAILAEPGLRYAGVQAYQGLVQHIHGFAERAAANDAANAKLGAILDALAGAGMPATIVSGGGTGSHLLDARRRLLTEIQAGSYIFMDEGYQPVDFHGDGAPVFRTSLFVAVTVVAHSAPGFAITDAGSKSLAVDGPPPRVFRDGVEIGRIQWCGDEYGRVLPHPGQAAPPVGTVLECTVPHCDPTVNLHDAYHAVRGTVLEGIWPVEARGRAD
jgi:D-serine deaminase-like pyridoxal phosphate-dependent protein